MCVTELDNFVKKFHQLWKAGVTAHLDLDAHAGRAWVGLQVQLGEVPAGQVHHPPHQHRGPDYQRRQERRKAARASSTADVGNLAAEASKTLATEESDENLEEIEGQPAEQAKTDLKCLICDFSSNWESGLHIHMTKKHANMEQVDGNETLTDDDLEDAKYSETSHYWRTGRLGTAYQAFIDANAIIEKSNLPEDAKKREVEKILDARKHAFGPNFSYVPPWNSKS